MVAEKSLDLKMNEAMSSGTLPEAYFQHPVVKRHGAGRVCPLALYCDDVPYSGTDSVLGVWIENLLLGT
eukprot:12028610-Alexandrium_andersonii.AAC.1